MAVREKDLQTNSWRGFVNGKWEHQVDVKDFIDTNITPYTGNHSFLAGPTEATGELWRMVSELTRKERENGGVLDVDMQHRINDYLTCTRLYCAG